MAAVLSPEVAPAKLLAPGLLTAVVCSAVLACLQVVYGGVSQEMPFAGIALLIFSGILGAFSGFFTVLVYAVLIWIYGKVLPHIVAGFVRTLALVALALGATFALQSMLLGVELLLTGEAPKQTVANLSWYLGDVPVSFDLVSLVTVGILYAGTKRYLGYSACSSGLLAILLVATNLAMGPAA